MLDLRAIHPDAPAALGPDMVDSADGPSAAAMGRLVRAVRDLAASRSLDEVVDIVRHAARTLVDADGATFVLREHDTCFYVAEDAIEPLWRGQRFPLGECISGWAMLNKSPVWIPDIYLDDRIPHVAYRATFVRSLAMTPIRTSEPLGAIGTYWADHHHATPAQIELLQALADSTAVALASIEVREGLERAVAERTRHLRATNRDLASFAHVAAHDLKAPLSTIVSYTRLALEEDTEGLSPSGLYALRTVQHQAARMSGLIDAVLAYSTAATDELELTLVDLDDLVGGVVRDLEGLIVECGAQIEVARLVAVPASRPLIERVVQNLITNAIVYGDPETPQVQVEAVVDADSVRLLVSDNGRGVPAEECESIFDMFSRGSSAVGSAGSGIGLAFARRVALRHGGTLRVDDGPLGGARFVLTLPLRHAPDVDPRAGITD